MKIPPSTPVGRRRGSCGTKILIILACTLLSLGAAALVFFQSKPVYQSTAKLLVRYVIERSGIDQDDEKLDPHQHRDGIMRAEMEILTSSDLAAEVAEAVGADRLVQDGSGGTVAPEQAAEMVQTDLRVESPEQSNILLVKFRHPDPEVARETLGALIDRYFILHLRIHRKVGTSDLLSLLDRMRSELARTESEIQERQASPEATEIEISKLERRRVDLQEQVRQFSASLEKAIIDENLLPGTMPNISIVQKPSKPVRIPSDRSMLFMLSIVAGGILLGIILACLPGRRARGESEASSS